MKKSLIVYVVAVFALLYTPSTSFGVPAAKKHLGIATYSVKGSRI